ncbi:hypothetical protein K435DRAFT_185365 [Dendrothele bispora CBS 962.96]|uniref:MYND-type domain-containing protein n=1 Tax=Dendrothele bispora (strain CBS 962.96) TaxID=1314807 RepID=A0A4S8KKV8_DENBC|nr:hypothetical protein K435DRAFT_185365 [Dendrothele bispora CBS 962.96]
MTHVGGFPHLYQGYVTIFPSALEGDSRTSVFNAMLLYLSTDFINLSIASFGHKIIIEVLRHRILSSVLLSFRHLTRHTLTGTSRDPLLTSTISQLEQAFVIFLDNLAAYTTYIKVLRCLGRAMKDMQESGLFTSTYSTPLNDALENLLQSLKNRLDDTQEYGKQLKTANACRNDFCPRGVVCDGSIFRCSGCRDALYCSKQCQREDWKHRHSVDCVEIATNKAEQAREYNLDYFLLQGTDKSREDFFRHSILYNEIKRRWIEVSQLLQHRPAPTVVMRADAPILHFIIRMLGERGTIVYVESSQSNRWFSETIRDTGPVIDESSIDTCVRRISLWRHSGYTLLA